MLVSSVILLVTLYVYQLVSKSFLNYQADNQQKAELNFFKHAMDQDLQHCDFAIESEAEEKKIVFVHENEQILYSFLSDKIIRTHPNRSDTFFIQTSQFEPYYSDSTFKMITGFQFSLNIKREIIPLLFVKRYSAVQLMSGENKIQEGHEY
jgi:hypothetical protein